jgi:hypothetical protein
MCALSKYRLRGYPGSVRDEKGAPVLWKGRPYDYKENKNVGKESLSSVPSKP